MRPFKLTSLFIFIVSGFLLFSLAACDKDDDNGGIIGNGNGNGNGNQQDHPENRKGSGESAGALLAANQYGKLTVEIQYVDGFKPTDEALKNFKSFLKKYLHKPDGITLKKTKISKPSGDNSYSINDIADIEDENRNVYTDGNEIGVYFLFVNGEHEDDTDDSKVLGVAYRNTSMVIFEETIRELSGSGPTEASTDKLETAVINHEIGHNLGLVANGSSMQTDHQDEDHGKHCDNNDCLMHWTVKTGDVVQKLVGGSVPELDQNCKDDLKANGGK